MATTIPKEDDVSTASAPQRAAATYDEIARRAYELFLGRDGQHGHDVEDWLQAEREMNEPPASTAG